MIRHRRKRRLWTVSSTRATILVSLTSEGGRLRATAATAPGKAFAHTAAYDARWPLVSKQLDSFPGKLLGLSIALIAPLRGSHQLRPLYGATGLFLAELTRGRKSLSFNIGSPRRGFSPSILFSTTCAIVKHRLRAVCIVTRRSTRIGSALVRPVSRLGRPRPHRTSGRGAACRLLAVRRMLVAPSSPRADRDSRASGPSRARGPRTWPPTRSTSRGSRRKSFRRPPARSTTTTARRERPHQSAEEYHDLLFASRRIERQFERVVLARAGATIGIGRPISLFDAAFVAVHRPDRWPETAGLFSVRRVLPLSRRCRSSRRGGSARDRPPRWLGARPRGNRRGRRARHRDGLHWKEAVQTLARRPSARPSFVPRPRRVARRGA